MDWFTFIAQMTKALAWPLSAVLIVLVFRVQLHNLIARVRKGKVGPAEFEFEEDVEAARAAVEADPATAPPPTSAAPAQVELATVDPRAAIISAWLSVEQAAALLAQKRGLLAGVPSRNPSAVIRAIDRAKLLDPPYVALFHDLRAMRNQAAHDVTFNPPADAVVNYLGLAEALRKRFESASDERSPGPSAGPPTG